MRCMSLARPWSIVLMWQLCPRENIAVHAQTPALLPFPDLTEPQTAFPQYSHPELDPQYIVRLPDVYLKARPLSRELLELPGLSSFLDSSERSLAQW